MAQKTLLSIVRSVASELNIPQPSVVTSSQDQSVLKLFSLVIAACDDMVNEYDWQMLQTRYTFNTVEGQADYTWPTDIERFISGTFFDTTNRWKLNGPLTPTGWEFLKATNLSTSPFERYRIWNGVISLYPTPGSTTLGMVYEYISNNYVINGSTGVKQNSFTQDSDVCMFDHRLIIYAVKMKWLASLEQDTTAALVDFTRAFELAKGADTPSSKLNLLGNSLSNPLLSTNNYPDGNWVV